jgi:oxygen-independent coproporphyrinogen-3 oxidase
LIDVNATRAHARENARMWPYHPELLTTPVPRYTSYPTAAEFHGGIGSAEHREGLAAITAETPISLYVHIPYCRQICWYCGCNTGAANRGQRLANYLVGLHREIALVASHLDGRCKVVRVSLGGGSPNSISPDQMRELAEMLRRHFRVDEGAIWSIELDPRGFDQPFADAIAEIGFARASLGIQTFDPAVQRRIGRVQDESLIATSIAMLRGAGVTSLNADLMYGLPGQHEAALLSSLETAVGLGADRLAVFGYAHVPHLIPRQRRIDADALPDAASRFRMAAAAHDWLSEQRWKAIGFDHYARRGDPLALAAERQAIRRNFQGFTDDPCDTLIGVGASAISRFAGALVQNEKNAGRYGLLVGNRILPGIRGIATPASERQRGRAIEQLLCNSAVDLSGFPALAEVCQRLAPFEERGLIDWAGAALTLSPDAQPYARTIAAALDPWRTSSVVRFSSAV